MTDQVGRSKRPRENEIDVKPKHAFMKVGDERPDETIENPEVRTKYTLAGKIVREALNVAISMCSQPGSMTKEICTACDEFIQSACEKVYTKTLDQYTQSTLAKGISCPTCVSVNQVVCHFSSSNESIELKEGDIVKISISCHIDGYPTMACHTLCVAPIQKISEEANMEATEESSIDISLLSYRRLALIHACEEAMAAILQQFRPGHTNKLIADCMSQVADKYNVRVLPNALSHEMKRYILNGRNVIVNRTLLGASSRDAHEFEIEANKIYHVDVLFGMLDKSVEVGTRDVFSFPTHIANVTEREEPKMFDLVPSDDHASTIFVRNVNRKAIRPKTANEALVIVKHNFLAFPFLGDAVFPESKAKSGAATKSLVENNLLDPLPVLESKKYVTTARFCCTVLVTSKETIVLCGGPLESGSSSVINQMRSHPINATSLEAVKQRISNESLARKICGPVEPCLELSNKSG
ncbi:hypothetical protein XU18_4416 [Perkinsela sp. CCAP 1560/4]|nr:hypothetical protein XU18_4416 [Perkinsela sp. CCAP 1560/4]|eukprot:KNH04206.1 hypothetical protein XU18_4416 [Perkinsela sp. CCAP 1560/4]